MTAVLDAFRVPDLRDDIGIDVTHETVRSWYMAEDVAA